MLAFQTRDPVLKVKSENLAGVPNKAISASHKKWLTNLEKKKPKKDFFPMSKSTHEQHETYFAHNTRPFLIL